MKTQLKKEKKISILNIYCIFFKTYFTHYTLNVKYYLIN